MPYRGGNYSYVIDSSFQPFSMQEMLIPFTAYKDAFEQSETAYNDLKSKADEFKYLSTTLPEGSKAREIYEGYANDLNKQAEDFSNNGLNMGNRSGLTSLKQRYSGEIGRLVKADEALKKERELRRTMNAKDPSMLWATDDVGLNIDSYLDGANPNLYGISGTELYTKAAAAGQAASKRVFSVGDGGSTLGGYYRDFVQKMGYTPAQLRQFGDQISQDFTAWASTNIPELGLAANQILEANGVNANLSGDSLRRAQQQVIRGLVDGAVYTESHNPHRDYGKLTASEIASLRASGFDEHGNYHMEWDPAYKRAKAIAEVKAGTGTGTTATGSKKSGSSGSGYGAIIDGKGVRLEWKGNNPNSLNGEADNDMELPKPIPDGEEYVGMPVAYDDLPQYIKTKIEKMVGNKGNFDDYIYYYRPYEGGFFNNTEAAVDIVPMRIQKGTGPEISAEELEAYQTLFGAFGKNPATSTEDDEEE